MEMQVTGGGTSGRTDPEPVQGPLGTGEKPLSTVAVARDEHRAAGVSKDGGTLYTSSIVSGREAPELLYSSHAKQEKDRLSAPSWDGRGDLWVADRDPSHPRLLRFAGGSGEPQNVPLVGLDGARIEGLRMSSDGVRIALLLFKDGHTTLKVGRVVRHGTADNPTVPAVEALRPAAPQMADVTAVSWAGRSRLVVVGKESRRGAAGALYAGGRFCFERESAAGRESHHGCCRFGRRPAAADGALGRGRNCADAAALELEDSGDGREVTRLSGVVALPA